MTLSVPVGSFTVTRSSCHLFKLLRHKSAFREELDYPGHWNPRRRESGNRAPK
jgi:hypothetical protein